MGSLVSGNVEYVPLSEAQEQLARAALHAVGTMATPVQAGTAKFLAFFDGTNNSIYNPEGVPLGEQKTAVARLFETLEPLTASRFNPFYLGGVGAVPEPTESAEGQLEYIKTGSAATGDGCIDRAERMYIELETYARTLSPGTELSLFASGFSRGAATARHFMNLVDERGVKAADGSWLYEPGSIRQSALLFDTVSTGQESVLELGIPASVDSVLHLVSADERRGSFPLTSILPASNSTADPRLNEIWLPGVHSDIGGAFPSYASAITELAAKTYLDKLGLETSGAFGDVRFSPTNPVTDYEWPLTPIYRSLVDLVNPGREVELYMDGLRNAGGEAGLVPEPRWANEALSQSRIDELALLYPGWTQPHFQTDKLAGSATYQGESLYLGDSGGVLADAGGGATLYGGAGVDWLLGNEGSTLEGGASDDHLFSDRSALLRGGLGSDEYYVTGGETIDDEDFLGTIHIPASTLNVRFTSDGHDLLISWDAQARGPIRVKGWLADDGSGRLPSLSVRADWGVGSGQLFSIAQVTNEMLRVTGTSEGETLTGVSGYRNTLVGAGGQDTLVAGNSTDGGELGDTLEGGLDNDILIGGARNDVYIYNRGDGRDTVQVEGGLDELHFRDVPLEQAAFARTGNDLVIELPEGGAVTLRNWFDTAHPQRLAFARFSDASLTEAEMTSRVGIRLPRPGVPV